MRSSVGATHFQMNIFNYIVPGLIRDIIIDIKKIIYLCTDCITTLNGPR